MRLKLGHKVFRIASIPLAFVVVAIALFALVQRSTIAAAQWADHSHQVLTQAHELSQSMLAAEDDQRGYLLTGRLSDLTRCRSAIAAARVQSAALERLVADNPGQANVAQQLDVLAALRLRALQDTIDKTGVGTGIRTQLVGRLQAGSRTMDDFRRLMQVFIDEEVRLQAIRDAALVQSFDLLDRLLVISAILAFVLTIVMIWFFDKGTIRRIADLGDKAVQFAQGKSLGPPAQLGSDDEIERADRAFHAMANTVAERQVVLDRYRLLAEHARDIILFLRRSDARIVEANAAAVDAYGYSREELLTLTASDLRVPEERLRLEGHLESSDHGPVYYESRHARKDGTSFSVEVTGQGAYIGGERMLMSIVRDVTDRKRAEEERDRFFDASIDMMCVANLGGYFIRLNPAWETTLGYTRQELKAIPFVELIHPQDIDPTATVMRALTEGRSVVSFENRYRRKDGDYRWFSWSAIPNPEEGLIYGVARDVTEQKQQAEELARSRDKANEASRTKSEFLANMSHEIRTPMNGIIGTTGLLRSMALNSEQREYVDIIHESGEALLTIINQILDLSKLEAGKVVLDSVDFSPLALVESVAMLFASAARAKNLSIQSYVEPDVPQMLRGDAGQLRQILINLTGNAVKFTDHGGIALKVAVDRAGESHVELRVLICDTGVGLSRDALTRLFQPFTQADNSTTRKYGGTGLGLSISKRLVELMGGEIGADPNEDGGMTFWFTARFERSSQMPATQNVPMFAGVRALVVDPDTVSRDILHLYMFNWGMRNGVVVTSSEEALEILKRAAADGDPYDLAFVDLGIAREGDGEIGRAAVQGGAIASTKLILIAPIATVGGDEGSLLPGYSYFLTKPIRQSYLFDCVAAALHRAGEAPGKASPGHDAASAPPEQRDVAGGRILVAEDNEVNRRLAAAQFKRLGVKADFVENGRQAVEAIASGDYELVFMDCQMPEMDGFEATRAIRKAELRSGKHVPIVAITANAMEGDRESCVARGMDDYLSKPVDFERLRLVLDRWLRRGGGALAAAAMKNGSAPLDMSRLREFFGNDDEALHALLRATIEESASVFERLRKALDERNSPAAQLAAHELKGFASNVGADQVAALAHQIENRSSPSGWQVAHDDAASLGFAIDRLVAFAAQELRQNGSRGED